VAALLELECHSLEENELIRNLGEHHSCFKRQDVEFKKGVMEGKITREGPFC